MALQTIDHALVFFEDTNKFDILEIEKISGFLKPPNHSSDFDRSTAYFVKQEGKMYFNILILEVGSEY